MQRSGEAPPSWLAGSPCAMESGRFAHGLQLCGTDLQLPFVPLAPQVAVMERVLQACTNGSVALLESPTGTGKSIALLTAALAWQRQVFVQHGAAPQIIYGVRTHAQLAQMVAELRKMPYRPRMAVIGSREQLCTNEEVKASARSQRVSLNLSCRQAARRAVQESRGVPDPAAYRRGGGQEVCACRPYVRLGEPGHAHRVFERCGRGGAVWDMEDLVKVAPSDAGGCPYYTAHVLAGNADVVFCPHNYILDPAISQCRSHHRERWSLRY